MRGLFLLFFSQIHICNALPCDNDSECSGEVCTTCDAAVENSVGADTGAGTITYLSIHASQKQRCDTTTGGAKAGTCVNPTQIEGGECSSADPGNDVPHWLCMNGMICAKQVVEVMMTGTVLTNSTDNIYGYPNTVVDRTNTTASTVATAWASTGTGLYAYKTTDWTCQCNSDAQCPSYTVPGTAGVGWPVVTDGGVSPLYGQVDTRACLQDSSPGTAFRNSTFSLCPSGYDCSAATSSSTTCIKAAGVGNSADCNSMQGNDPQKRAGVINAGSGTTRDGVTTYLKIDQNVGVPAEAMPGIKRCSVVRNIDYALNCCQYKASLDALRLRYLKAMKLSPYDSATYGGYPQCANPGDCNVPSAGYPIGGPGQGSKFGSNLGIQYHPTEDGTNGAFLDPRSYTDLTGIDVTPMRQLDEEDFDATMNFNDE